MASPAAHTSASAAPPSLLDLDTPILVLVAQHLPWRQVLDLSLVCRRCAELAREPALWRHLLRTEFDLAFRPPAGGAVAGGAWRDAFRSATAAASLPLGALNFAGVYTDGGTDGEARYTVDALFSTAVWEAFCTSSSRNVHCVGLLRPRGAGGEHEAARRAYLQQRCAVAATLLFGTVTRRGPGRAAPGQRGFAPEADLTRWSKAELEALFLQLFDLLTQNHPLGALLFAGVTENQQQELERCAVLAVELRGVRHAVAIAAVAEESHPVWGAHVTPPLRLFTHPPPMPPAAPQPVACVSGLRISRAGQFSCPLQSGAVLMGDAPPPPQGADPTAPMVACVDESRMLRVLDDATSLETVQDAAAAGALPRIVHVGTCHAGVWAEFEARGRATTPHVPPGAFWPVAWFAFTPRAEAATRAAAEDAAIAAQIAAAGPTDVAPQLADEDRFDVMDVVLTQRHAGEIACAKLIASENLMEQWGDEHPHPNIDVAAVNLLGFAARPPLAAQVEAMVTGA